MKEENGMTATPVEPIVSPFYDRDGITIYNADCRDVLPFLERFDLLLTDPPYGLGDNFGHVENKKGQQSRLWSAGCAKWNADIDDATILAARSNCGNSIVWGGNYYTLPSSRCWLIWDKVQEFTGADAELAWTTLDMPVKTWRMARVEAYKPSKNGGICKTHPTQKPLPLIQWCLNLAGDVSSVLDPFMGSGTTLVAAKLLGLRAVGIEINREYCEVAVSRLRQGVLDFGSEG